MTTLQESSKQNSRFFYQNCLEIMEHHLSDPEELSAFLTRSEVSSKLSLSFSEAFPPKDYNLAEVWQKTSPRNFQQSLVDMTQASAELVASLADELNLPVMTVYEGVDMLLKGHAELSQVIVQPGLPSQIREAISTFIVGQVQKERIAFLRIIRLFVTAGSREREKIRRVISIDKMSSSIIDHYHNYDSAKFSLFEQSHAESSLSAFLREESELLTLLLELLTLDEAPLLFDKLVKVFAEQGFDSKINSLLISLRLSTRLLGSNDQETADRNGVLVLLVLFASFLVPLSSKSRTNIDFLNKSFETVTQIASNLTESQKSPKTIFFFGLLGVSLRSSVALLQERAMSSKLMLSSFDNCVRELEFASLGDLLQNLERFLVYAKQSADSFRRRARPVLNRVLQLLLWVECSNLPFLQEAFGTEDQRTVLELKLLKESFLDSATLMEFWSPDESIFSVFVNKMLGLFPLDKELVCKTANVLIGDGEMNFAEETFGLLSSLPNLTVQLVDLPSNGEGVGTKQRLMGRVDVGSVLVKSVDIGFDLEIPAGTRFDPMATIEPIYQFHTRLSLWHYSFKEILDYLSTGTLSYRNQFASNQTIPVHLPKLFKIFASVLVRNPMLASRMQSECLCPNSKEQGEPFNERLNFAAENFAPMIYLLLLEGVRMLVSEFNYIKDLSIILKAIKSLLQSDHHSNLCRFIILYPGIISLETSDTHPLLSVFELLQENSGKEHALEACVQLLEIGRILIVSERVLSSDFGQKMNDDVNARTLLGDLTDIYIEGQSSNTLFEQSPMFLEATYTLLSSSQTESLVNQQAIMFMSQFWNFGVKALASRLLTENFEHSQKNGGRIIQLHSLVYRCCSALLVRSPSSNQLLGFFKESLEAVPLIKLIEEGLAVQRTSSGNKLISAHWNRQINQLQNSQSKKDISDMYKSLFELLTKVNGAITKRQGMVEGELEKWVTKNFMTKEYVQSWNTDNFSPLSSLLAIVLQFSSLPQSFKKNFSELTSLRNFKWAYSDCLFDKGEDPNLFLLETDGLELLQSSEIGKFSRPSFSITDQAFGLLKSILKLWRKSNSGRRPKLEDYFLENGMTTEKLGTLIANSVRDSEHSVICFLIELQKSDSRVLYELLRDAGFPLDKSPALPSLLELLLGILKRLFLTNGLKRKEIRSNGSFASMLSSNSSPMSSLHRLSLFMLRLLDSPKLRRSIKDKFIDLGFELLVQSQLQTWSSDSFPFKAMIEFMKEIAESNILENIMETGCPSIAFNLSRVQFLSKRSRVRDMSLLESMEYVLKCLGSLPKETQSKVLVMSPEQKSILIFAKQWVRVFSSIQSQMYTSELSEALLILEISKKRFSRDFSQVENDDRIVTIEKTVMKEIELTLNARKRLTTTFQNLLMVSYNIFNTSINSQIVIDHKSSSRKQSKKTSEYMFFVEEGVDPQEMIEKSASLLFVIEEQLLMFTRLMVASDRFGEINQSLLGRSFTADILSGLSLHQSLLVRLMNGNESKSKNVKKEDQLTTNSKTAIATTLNSILRVTTELFKNIKTPEVLPKILNVLQGSIHLFNLIHKCDSIEPDIITDVLSQIQTSFKFENESDEIPYRMSLLLHTALVAHPDASNESTFVFLTNVMSNQLTSSRTLKVLLMTVSFLANNNITRPRLLMSSLTLALLNISFSQYKEFNNGVMYLNGVPENGHVTFTHLLQTVIDVLGSESMEGSNKLIDFSLGYNFLSRYQSRFEKILGCGFGVEGQTSNIQFQSLEFLIEFRLQLVFINILLSEVSLWSNRSPVQFVNFFKLLSGPTLQSIFGNGIKGRSLHQNSILERFRPVSHSELCLNSLVGAGTLRSQALGAGDELSSKSLLENNFTHNQPSNFYCLIDRSLSEVSLLLTNCLVTMISVINLGDLLISNSVTELFFRDFATSISDIQSHLITSISRQVRSSDVSSYNINHLKGTYRGTENRDCIQGMSVFLRYSTKDETISVIKKSFEACLLLQVQILQSFDLADVRNRHFYLEDLRKIQEKSLVQLSEFENFVFRGQNSLSKNNTPYRSISRMTPRLAVIQEELGNSVSSLVSEDSHLKFVDFIRPYLGFK